MYSKSDYLEENLEFIKGLLKEQTPISEIARKLEVKYETLKRFLSKKNIEYTTNPNRKGRPHYESRVSAMYYIENNLPVSAPVLRKKLIEEGIKENKCERCGITEWMDGLVPIELHHKDGNHYNNAFDNIILLCSNCHAQLHGYNTTIGEPTKSGDKKNITKRCEICGCEFETKNPRKKCCSPECSEKLRKKNREKF